MPTMSSLTSPAGSPADDPSVSDAGEPPPEHYTTDQQEASLLRQRGKLPPLLAGQVDWSSAPKQASTEARMPVVRFRAPLLSSIHAGRKRLDMRLADDPATRHLAPGSIVVCEQGHPTPMSMRLRVTGHRQFSTAGDAWRYYHSIGK